jgi:hypothetical protein
MPGGSTGRLRGGIQTQEPPGGGPDPRFESHFLQHRAEQTVIPCLQPIARSKVADAGEDRVEHWIDEGIDLRIYTQIWKAAAPADLIDVAVLCASDDPPSRTATQLVG